MEEKLKSDEFLKTSNISFLEKNAIDVFEIKYLDTELKGNPENTENPEMSLEIPEMKLKIMSKVGALGKRSVSSIVKNSQIEELNEKFGIDINSMTQSVLDNEVSQNLNKDLYERYRTLGERSKDILYTKWQKKLLKYFKNLKITNYIEDNPIGSRIAIIKILRGSNIIATRSRRGPAKFLVCSSGIASIIQDSPGFVFNNTGSVVPGGNIQKVGEIAGIIVFVNPYLKFNDGLVTLGRKTMENDPGVHFVFKNPEYASVVSPETLETINRLDIKTAIVEAGLYPENSYINLDFTIGKKPLWKKILGI